AGGLDGAEQAVGFVVDPGGEQQSGRSAGDAVAKAQRPQALDLDRAAILVPQAATERPGLGVVGVDAAVAEVSHQQVAAEATEPGGRGLHQAPGGVEVAAAEPAPQQVAAGAVDVHEAPARAGDLVFAVGVLLGVGDIQPPAELLDVEGCIAAWQLAVVESARQVDPVELLVEDVDPAVVEVGPVEQGAGSAGGEGQALVDGVRDAGADLGLSRGWGRRYARVPAGAQPGPGC